MSTTTTTFLTSMATAATAILDAVSAFATLLPRDRAEAIRLSGMDPADARRFRRVADFLHAPIPRECPRDAMQRARARVTEHIRSGACSIGLVSLALEYTSDPTQIVELLDLAVEDGLGYRGLRVLMREAPPDWYEGEDDDGGDSAGAGSNGDSADNGGDNRGNDLKVPPGIYREPGLYTLRRGTTHSTIAVTLSNDDYAGLLGILDSIPGDRAATLMSLVRGRHSGSNSHLVINVTAQELADARRDIRPISGHFATNYGVSVTHIPLGSDISLLVHDLERRSLDMHRLHRCAVHDQRVALSALQDYCAYPGCTRPVAECQVHHIIPFSHGGPTDIDNLVALCPHHHGMIDDTRSRGAFIDADMVWHSGGRTGSNRFMQRHTARSKLA